MSVTHDWLRFALSYWPDQTAHWHSLLPFSEQVPVPGAGAALLFLGQ